MPKAAEKSAYEQKVLELCTRRGIYAEKGLADKLEAMGYGRDLGIKHVRNHLNRALQRKHIKAINFALHTAIIEALELGEAEEEELRQARKPPPVKLSKTRGTSRPARKKPEHLNLLRRRMRALFPYTRST